MVFLRVWGVFFCLGFFLVWVFSLFGVGAWFYGAGCDSCRSGHSSEQRCAKTLNQVLQLEEDNQISVFERLEFFRNYIKIEECCIGWVSGLSQTPSSSSAPKYGASGGSGAPKYGGGGGGAAYSTEPKASHSTPAYGQSRTGRRPRPPLPVWPMETASH